MFKACNDTWNNKKGRSCLQVNMLPSFSLRFWKDLLSQHLKSTVWNQTNVPTCFVCCAISCWKPIVNGAFEIFICGNVLFVHERKKKPMTMPSLLFRSCWWKPISEQEFFETIKMSKHRNLLNQGNCTSTTLYFFFWLVTAEI